MGTKKTPEEFLKGLSAYHEVFDIVDDPEYSETQLLEFAKEYADYMSTSQKETIERLREENKRLDALRKAHHDFICSYKFGELWNHSSQYKIFKEEFPEKGFGLLSTTEPIDQ